MVEDPPDRITLDDVERSIPVATALSPTRDGLLKKALCYSPRWGEIDFTVPMFDTFLKRWIPDLGSVAGS